MSAPMLASTLERCVRMRLLIDATALKVRTLCVRTSALAARAIVGGALALRQLANRRAAFPARQSATLVDVQLLAEITRLAICAHVVAERRAPYSNGHCQYGAHRTDQALHLGAGEGPSLSARPDAGFEEGFTRVDVADTDH